MDKFRAIDYFMKVAECGSISSAAHALDVTPSAVSKVIAGFEKSLGFALFHRSTRSLSLTADGTGYLECCRQILRDLEKAETDRRQERLAPSGMVKLAMHPAFRNPFYAEIAEWMNRFPELRFETKISNSPDVLFDEGFDLMIRAGDLPDSTLVARHIGHLEFVLAASPRYLERFGEPKTPADLERHRWVLPKRIDTYLGNSPHWVFTKGRQSCPVTVQSHITMRDSIGTPEAVIGGMGIGCLYTVALMRPIELGLVKPLLNGWTTPGRPVYAVFPNKQVITPRTLSVVQYFADLLARAGRQFDRS